MQEDFEYAKEAIKAGVLNYILKPIDEEEFRQALINAKNVIQNESAQRRYISRLQEEAENGYAIAKRQFLNMLISSPEEAGKEYFSEKIKKFKINITSQNVLVIVCEIDHLHEKWMDESDQQLWSYALYNITEELLAEYGHNVVFQGPQNRIVVILNEKDEDSVGNIKSYYDCCNKVLNMVKKYLDFTITIGIGTGYQKYTGIYFSYKEAIKALEYKFFKGNDRIIEYRMITQKNSTNDIFIFEDKDKILIDLRTGNCQDIYIQIDEVFNQMMHKKIQKHYIQMTAMELASIAVEFAIENNLHITNILKTEKDIFDIIKNRETIKEIIEWLKDFYQ